MSITALCRIVNRWENVTRRVDFFRRKTESYCISLLGSQGLLVTHMLTDKHNIQVGS